MMEDFEIKAKNNCPFGNEVLSLFYKDTITI